MEEREEGGLKGTSMWIAWLGATLVAAVSMSAFVYSNFETVEHAKETKAEIKDMFSEIKSELKEIRAAQKK